MSAKNKSLTIWNMIGTDNFSGNAFKRWGYDQIFNLLMLEGQINYQLIQQKILLDIWYILQ